MTHRKSFVPKTHLILVFLCLSAVIHSHAQYQTALGVRIGGTSGLAAKYFYRPELAMEGIFGTFGNGFSVTALIEKYAPVYDAPGLYVYYGGGAHLAFYNGKSSNYSNFGHEVDYRKNNDVGFGINGIVGIEYRLPDKIPVAFSLDLKPFMEIGSGGYVAVAPDPSIGIKFILR